MISHSERGRRGSSNNYMDSPTNSGRQSPVSPRDKESPFRNNLELPDIHGSSNDKRRRSFNLEELAFVINVTYS